MQNRSNDRGLVPEFTVYIMLFLINNKHPENLNFKNKIFPRSHPIRGGGGGVLHFCRPGCIQQMSSRSLNVTASSRHSYADDIQLYCSGKAATGQIMNARMVACIEEISGWMTANRLKLNTDKTQFIWHGTRVQLMKVDISSIELDGVNIPVSTEVRCLGVVLDGELTFASHTRQLSRNCFYQLRQLWSVRRLLTKDAAKTLVHASILSRIGYCNSVLNHACAVHLRPLQSVLHSAARLILRIRKYDRISAATREELHWLPVHHRIRFKTCALVHKCLHGLALSYLIDMIGSVSKEPGRRHLRSAARGDLVVPASRTRTFGPRAFAISGPDSWNNIPVALRDTALSFHEFCVKLKTELYRQIN